MTLTGLRYFVALAELRNFSRVGERFFVAQSAVTYQIRNLEIELHVKLFERSTRSVKLTPAGHQLYLEIAPLLEQLDEIYNKFQAKQGKTFTLGYSRVCFGGKFKRMTDSLAAAHPDVDFLLELAEPEIDLFERIHSGLIDAALFFFPSPDLPTYLDYMKFRHYPRKLVCSDQSRYAGLSCIKEMDIESKRIYACEGMRLIEQMSIITANGTLEPKDNREIMLKDMESVLAMVKTGRGVALLPMIDDLSITGLRYIPIVEEKDILGPGLVLAWNKGSDSPELRSVRELALELFEGKEL